MAWPVVAAMAAGAAAKGAQAYMASKGGPKLHGWQERAMKRYTHAAADQAKKEWKPYEGLPYAPANENLRRGWGYGGDMMQTGYDASQGAARGFNNAANAYQNASARNAYTGAAGNTYGNLSRFEADKIQIDPITGEEVIGQTKEFMNPYTDEVIDRYRADADRARQAAQVNRSDQFGSIGALGGSAHQLADVRTNEAFARSTGNMAAQLRKSGYDDAFQRAMGLISGNRQMDYNVQGANQQAGIQSAGVRGNAASGLSNLGQYLGNFGLARAQGMGNLAAQQGRYGQAQFGQGYGLARDQQNYLDKDPAFQYQQWALGQARPYQNIAMLGGAAGMAGGAAQTAGTSNPWLNALFGAVGGAAQGYAAGKGA